MLFTVSVSVSVSNLNVSVFAKFYLKLQLLWTYKPYGLHALPQANISACLKVYSVQLETNLLP